MFTQHTHTLTHTLMGNKINYFFCSQISGLVTQPAIHTLQPRKLRMAPFCKVIVWIQILNLVWLGHVENLQRQIWKTAKIALLEI